MACKALSRLHFNLALSRALRLQAEMNTIRPGSADTHTAKVVLQPTQGSYPMRSGLGRRTFRLRFRLIFRTASGTGSSDFAGPDDPRVLDADHPPSRRCPKQPLTLLPTRSARVMPRRVRPSGATFRTAARAPLAKMPEDRHPAARWRFRRIASCSVPRSTEVNLRQPAIPSTLRRLLSSSSRFDPFFQTGSAPSPGPGNRRRSMPLRL